MQLVTFTCDGTRGGIPVSAVREIARMVAITALPGAPPPIEGVIDVRGLPSPVLDVRARFGLATRPAQESDHLIVAAVGGRQVALRVDDVDDVVTIDAGAVRAATGLAAAAPTVAGVVQLEDGLLVVHDVEAFLTAAEADALAAAEQAAGRSATGD